MNKDTIAAIATPVGYGGIGIIRLSGTKAFAVAQHLFQPADRADSNEKHKKQRTITLRSHQLTYGHILDPQTRQCIDEVLLVAMKAPKSYTCEDVVEIHTHSGPAVLHAVLNQVVAQGVRLAEPGEFTRRAFTNGRIDLSQAEGIIDIINARSENALKLAASQIHGDLKKHVEKLRAIILDQLAHLEVAIDFVEDVADPVNYDLMRRKLNEEVLPALQKLLADYQEGHIFREGIKIGIIGRPNVGKSSLLNCLVAKQRAIVTPTPGTTRDLIEAELVLNGIPLVVTDTAGIHATADPIEKIGIDMTLADIKACDLILLVFDATDSNFQSSTEIIAETKDKPTIGVINKIDLKDWTGKTTVPHREQFFDIVFTSAKLQRGIDELKRAIAAAITGDVELDLQNRIVPNVRQKEAVATAVAMIESAIDGIATNVPEELITIDLQAALDALGEILGTTVKEEVLDNIFSRFCIGK